MIATILFGCGGNLNKENSVHALSVEIFFQKKSDSYLGTRSVESENTFFGDLCSKANVVYNREKSKLLSDEELKKVSELENVQITEGILYEPTSTTVKKKKSNTTSPEDNTLYTAFKTYWRTGAQKINNTSSYYVSLVFIYSTSFKTLNYKDSQGKSTTYYLYKIHDPIVQPPKDEVITIPITYPSVVENQWKAVENKDDAMTILSNLYKRKV